MYWAHHYNCYHHHFNIPCFFSSLAWSSYLSLFSHSFSFTLFSAGMAKFTIWQVLFLFFIFIFLLTSTRSGHLVKIRWPVCISKFLRILCVSFSRTDSVFCIHHLFVWSNVNFLYNSQWITFPTQSCLVYYYYYLGGARGVRVIVIGNEHGDTSSNPGRHWFHFT